MAGKKRRGEAPAAASGPTKKLKLPSNGGTPVGETPSLTGEKGGEEDFPRGGQGVLTALEKRLIRDQATKDALFNESGGGGGGGGGGEKESGVRVVKTAKRRSAAGTKSQRRVETLAPKTLVPGVLVLGAVQEIRDFEISVSLPYNMCGTVTIGNVSDPLTEGVIEEEGEEEGLEQSSSVLRRVFFPGQLAVCCVLGEGEKGGKRRSRGVDLTVNPRIVNIHLTPRDITEGMVLSGWVKSVEDHGYIIDFGVSGKTGFLLKKNAAQFVRECNKGKPLVCGQITRCKVLSGVDARSVPVSVDPGVVGGALVGGDSLVQLHALQPGLLVNTAVKEVVSKGVIVSFLGGFEGSVGLRHLPSCEATPTSLQPRKKIRGRLLWVDVEEKKVGVSLQRTLVEGRSHTFQGVEFGDTFESAQITKVFSDSSLLLKLSSGCHGYCPHPLVSDEMVEKLGVAHREGSRHACRVVQFNLIDGAAIVSLQPSVLTQRYLRYSDISVGDLLEATVERHGSYGMIVSIQGSIRGLCPFTHISDGQLRDPQRRHQPGKTVKCRVLHVEAGERRVLLTCKKSLLRLSEEEVLRDYTRAEVGRVFKGVVNRVEDRGFSVFFFNNVRGYVPQSEMGREEGSFPQPSSVVHPGQVVECRVLSCDQEKKRLQLSLRVDCGGGAEVRERLRPGMVMVGEVGGVGPEGVRVQCRETGEFGFLPAQHLSDYPSHCAGLLSQHQVSLEEAVKEGRPYELQDVLVVCGRQSFRPALLSLKPSLHRSATNGWAENHSHLKAGQLLTGFIKKAMSYGCFVEFPHNLSALAPTKYLEDQFTSDPTLVYQEGQTVFAKVLEVNEDKRRFLVSLRPSDVCVGGDSGEEEERRSVLGERLEQFLAERGRLSEHSLLPGTSVRGKVSSVEGEEVMIQLEGLLGKSSTHTAPGMEVCVGEEIVSCVLSVEGEEVRVSLNPALLERCDLKTEGGEKKKKKRRSSAKKQAMCEDTRLEEGDTQLEEGDTRLEEEDTRLKEGGSVVGTVELATPQYLLVSLKTTLPRSLLAYAATDSGQLEVPNASYSNIRIGQKLSATVYSSAADIGGKPSGLPIVVVTGTRVNNSKETQRSQTKPSYMNVDTGDIIDVIVKGVKTNFLSVQYHLWQGRVHCCLATDKPRPGHTPFAEVHPGDVVRARVVGMRKKEIKRLASKKGASITTLELTTRASLLDSGVELRTEELLRSKFREGEELTGFVNEVNERGVLVHLSPRTQGHVPLMLAHSDYTVLRNLRRHFVEGEAVRCTVVSGRRKKGNYPVVSLIGGVATPTVGSILECLVHETTPLSLTVSAPWWAGFGRVDITDAADEYTEDPLERFRETREGVRVCVVKVEGDRMDLSLRPSRLSPGQPEGDSPDREITSLGDLSEGGVVRGYVKAVTAVGVFVRLGRRVDGRVQIKNLADGFVKNFKEKFRIGQLVTAKVLSVDAHRGQVELSLRLSHVDPAASKRERRRADRKRAKREERENKMESDGASADSDSSETCSEEEEEEEEGEEVEEEEMVVKPTLQLSGCEGFVWEREEKTSELEGSDDEEQEDAVEKESVSSKKSRRQKKAALKAEEEELYQAERAQLEEARAPENVEDFERLLLSRPDSSALWVQYMAFLLQSAEVDRARGVGEKALQTISFREEGEKLNVWVARLNLENLYGSQESLMAVFQSALQQNDPLQISRRLASIYQDSKKMDLAEQLYQTMTRQFRSELSVWTEFGLFLVKRGKLEAARRLLQRCLKTLSLKQQHVEMISKFAQWEFRYGDGGRGGTMFEGLLASYPRRSDLWSVYVDMLVKSGQTDQAREVLERAIHLKLNAKKMKLMFKKYMEFERQYGTPAGVEVVKDKARTYVEAQQET